MFDLEDYNAETHRDFRKADYLRLEAGQRIRNITLTGVTDGENQFGYYCIGFFKTESGARGFINLSPKLVDELTVESTSGIVLNPELRDKKIWIGKKSFITVAGEQRSFFEWGAEQA